MGPHIANTGQPGPAAQPHYLYAEHLSSDFLVDFTQELIPPDGLDQQVEHSLPPEAPAQLPVQGPLIPWPVAHASTVSPTAIDTGYTFGSTHSTAHHAGPSPFCLN